jgi:hypothetical protein
MTRISIPDAHHLGASAVGIGGSNVSVSTAR